MTTSRGEISDGRPGSLNKQLSGKVYLAQNKGEWPVTLMFSESQVITWLTNYPDGAVWEYEVKPVRRVKVQRPEPYLSGYVEVEATEMSAS